MQNKSVCYKTAALKLLAAGRYAQAVSMFYYSALQKMMYVCAEKVSPSLTYEEQTRPEVNTHACVRDRVYNAIHRNEKEGLYSVFGQLHELRIKAEYSSDMISQTEVADARSLNECIDGYLKRNFGI